MMADDIATYPGNPHPHQIFNRPGGVDVYEGVPVVNSASQTVLVAGHCCTLESTCFSTAWGLRYVCDNPQSSNMHELLLLTYTHIHA